MRPDVMARKRLGVDKIIIITGATKPTFNGVRITAYQSLILRMTLEGYQVKQIGFELKAKFSTISRLRARLMKRVGVSTLAGLIRVATKEGLDCDAKIV